MKKLALALMLLSAFATSCNTPLKPEQLKFASEQALVECLLDGHPLDEGGFNPEVYRENKRLLRAEIVSRQSDWVEPYRSAVVRGQLLIGMTNHQAVISRGRPTSVHRSTYAHGETEQWVYRIGSYYALYVYFDDGILTAIQN